MNSRIPVGILGATGTVGQRFIQLLDNHFQFYIECIGASPKNVDKLYGTICNWKMTCDMPDSIKNMVLVNCNPESFKKCKIIFSALDDSVAGEIELDFLKHNFYIFSNAKNHRMNELVPLIVPTVNPEHFSMISISKQQLHFNTKGFLVTNANCSTTGIAVALKALQNEFGPLSKVMVTTMQAISGAGYPGVPSLDILNNVIPYISGEEKKIETELLKILDDPDLIVSASCNRVPVIDGHTQSIFVEFKCKENFSPEKIIKVFEEYHCKELPQIKPIIMLHGIDRPQPRLDVENYKNSVVVGRVRKCNIFDIKFTLLCHNTILGAAGSSIMNAEIAVSKGLINLP